MLKAHRRLVPGITVVGTLVVLLVSGCGGGGGDGGGAVGPTAPTIADVSGSWSGSYTLESATGCGCIGATTQLLIGLAVTSSTEISQNGTAIQGTWKSPWTAELCDFEGTVGSESLNAEATGCVLEEYLDMECPNGSRRDLHWSSSTLQATALGNDMNGTLMESWDCSDGRTGEPKGTLILHGRIQQRRG